MKIGQSISAIRKENQLSQDQFADLFHVTRQTVSNWENEKSYPDLETILNISEQFNISVDMLLRSDKKTVEKMEGTRTKKKALLITLLAVMGISLFALIFITHQYEEKNKIAFTMEHSQTYQTSSTENNRMDVQTGHFILPKSGKVNVAFDASTDDGELIIEVMKNPDGARCYEITGSNIKDKQIIYLESGAYTIKVMADDYTENIVSLSYNIKINN